MSKKKKKRKKENLARVFALLPTLISVKSGSCGRVKNYLWERGIQLSDDGKGKKKAELFDLCKKAAAIKQIRLASAKDRKRLLEEKYKQIGTNFQ